MSPFVVPSGRPASDRAPQVLDPRSLGRPVHRLEVFTRRLRVELDEGFVQPLNRRYRACFDLQRVEIAPVASGADEAYRWHVLASGRGRMGFSIDRPLLMAVLSHRYGLRAHGPGGDAPQGLDAAPETASEARLSMMLAHQWADMVASCIEAFQGEPGAAEGPSRVFTPVAHPHAGTAGCGADAWMVSAHLAEAALGVAGRARVVLDAAWMAHLLRHLAPTKEGAQPDVVAGLPPLPGRLMLTLQARLLEQELPLGTLLDLRVGDVLPARLGAADVLIDEAQLFRAAVAEHQGKLCLTAFENLE